MRAILGRLGYKLVDTYGEASRDIIEPPQIFVGSSAKFWWVNQSVNFEPVYHDGTLWAPLTNSRGHRVDHWQTLETVVPGDFVIHYASPEVRGLSRVATKAQPALPPRGYNDVPADTQGTVVLTGRVQEIRLPRDLALEVLGSGHGPVTSGGRLRNGYFFPLDTDQALELLRRAGLEPSSEPGDESAKQGEPFDSYLGGASDRVAVVAVRAEQRFLRDQQLRRWRSLCSLCGRSFPEEFLVAAHIKPRWACSELERMDTQNVSMLACLFGCDALFELGYAVVGDEGIIECGGRHSKQITDRLRDIVGRTCLAHGNASRKYFAWHRRHHSTMS